MLDRKKGPFLGLFGRKTGVFAKLFYTLFCTFPVFWGFLHSQAIVEQQLTRIRPLLKKSCLKSHGRFLGLQCLCHTGRVSVGKDIRDKTDAEDRPVGAVASILPISPMPAL